MNKYVERLYIFSDQRTWYGTLYPCGTGIFQPFDFTVP